MHVWRRSFVSLVAIVLMVGLLGAGLVLAQEPDANEPASTQVTVSPTFIYQGELRKDGAPVDGTQCTFTFELWNDPQSGQGTKIGTQTVTRTPENGHFSAELNFGADAFTGEPRYLEVYVDCGDGQTQLNGRQPLRPAPYAIGLMPGATIAGAVNNGGVLTLENSSNDGLRVDSAGDDGVHVHSSDDDGVYINSATGDGIEVAEADEAGFQANAVSNHGV